MTGTSSGIQVTGLMTRHFQESQTVDKFLNSFLLLVVLLLRLGYLMPGGYIPRLEIMERECWKFLDWRLNSDNDSRLHGQPSSSKMHFIRLMPGWL